MADSEPAFPADPDDASGGPPVTPRWVKLGAIAAIILVLLAVLVMKMSGGQHGPSRHTPGGGNPGGHTPPAEHSP